MKLTKGKKLKFIIYATIVEGTFIETISDGIVILTTKDPILELIGKEQSIHKKFLIDESD